MANVRRFAKQAAVAVYAGAAAALPVAVAHHWLSASDAQDIGVIVAAVAAGWHSGLTVADRYPKLGGGAATAPPPPGVAPPPSPLVAAASLPHPGDLGVDLPGWEP